MSAKSAGKTKQSKQAAARQQPLEEPMEETAAEQIAAEVTLADTDEKIRQLTEENDRLRDQMLRNRAEFENYKKRRSVEFETLSQLANEGLVSDLLPVLDDLDLLLDHTEKNGQASPLYEGAEKIRQKLWVLLERRGVSRIEAEGKPFNPDEHEALMQQPSPDVEPGHVLAVHQHGYRFGNKLLRPSRVIVASKPGE
ncbi:MAG: nucleotide exchange factor GrpE [bacterium]